MATPSKKKAPAPVPQGYILVEELRQKLIMPGRDKPITRAACDRLINKWTRERKHIGAGQGRKACIPQEISAKVVEYFSLKHQRPSNR